MAEVVSENRLAEMRVVICSECGKTIGDTGLCSYKCKNDGLIKDQREPETMKVLVFKFDREESYVRPRVR